MDIFLNGASCWAFQFFLLRYMDLTLLTEYNLLCLWHSSFLWHCNYRSNKSPHVQACSSWSQNSLASEIGTWAQVCPLQNHRFFGFFPVFCRSIWVELHMMSRYELPSTSKPGWTLSPTITYVQTIFHRWGKHHQDVNQSEGGLESTAMIISWGSHCRFLYVEFYSDTSHY